MAILAKRRRKIIGWDAMTFPHRIDRIARAAHQQILIFMWGPYPAWYVNVLNWKYVQSEHDTMELKHYKSCLRTRGNRKWMLPSDKLLVLYDGMCLNDVVLQQRMQPPANLSCPYLCMQMLVIMSLNSMNKFILQPRGTLERLVRSRSGYVMVMYDNVRWCPRTSAFLFIQKRNNATLERGHK